MFWEFIDNLIKLAEENKLRGANRQNEYCSDYHGICGNRHGNFNYWGVVPVSPKRPLTILVFLGTRRDP